MLGKWNSVLVPPSEPARLSGLESVSYTTLPQFRSRVFGGTSDGIDLKKSAHICLPSSQWPQVKPLQRSPPLVIPLFTLLLRPQIYPYNKRETVFCHSWRILSRIHMERLQGKPYERQLLYYSKQSRTTVSTTSTIYIFSNVSYLKVCDVCLLRKKERPWL